MGQGSGEAVSLMLMEVCCRRCHQVLAARDGERLRLLADERTVAASHVATTLRCPRCSPGDEVTGRALLPYVSRQAPVPVTLFPKV